MGQFLLGVFLLASIFLLLSRALANTGAGSRPGRLTAPVRGFARCAAFVLVLAHAPVAFANPAGFTQIPDDPCCVQTGASAINDAGEIVGGADPGGGPHCFFLPSGGSSGDYNNFDVTGGAACTVFGINNHDQIVGGYEQPIPVGRAFAGTPGAPLPFVPLGSAEANAEGINDAGSIVGVYRTIFHGSDHGFIGKIGAFTTFDLPGKDGTALTGINNKGELAGYYTSSGAITGFSTDAKGNLALTVPGAIVKGINDAGQIVGYYPGGSGFVFTPGTTTPTLITIDGASITEVTGINNKGKIVGIYFTPNYHSFTADAPSAGCQTNIMPIGQCDVVPPKVLSRFWLEFVLARSPAWRG